MSGALARMGGVPDLSNMGTRPMMPGEGERMLRHYLSHYLEKLERGEVHITSFTLDQRSGYSKGEFYETSEITGKMVKHTIEVV